MAFLQSKFCIPYENKWINSYLGNLQIPWKPISLTFVSYPEGDFIAKCLAWSSLLPIFIIVSFITLILFRREIHTIVFFLGIILNEMVNMILKYSFQSPRPCRPGDEKLLYNIYGMPSSHAQFMSFFAVYMTFFAYIRLHTHLSESIMDNIRKHMISISSLAAALIVSVSRIYLYYHTVDQVVTGLIVGAITGSIWFYMVEKYFSPFFQDIVNTKLAEYFLIRDSTTIPDILWFEYTASRTEARQRQKRIPSKSQ